jgi:hypothetical protein
MQNEFTIKINKDANGNDLSLASMSVEASSALVFFLNSLTELASSHNSNGNVTLCLRDGCVESTLVYPSDDLIIQNEINDIVYGNSNNNESIKILKQIQSKIKENGLDYTISHFYNNNSEDFTLLFKQRNFKLNRGPRIEWHESIDFLQGKLYEAGGKVKTNVHVENVNGEYKIECSQEQAKDLNKRLYDNVSLCVLKKQKANNKDIYELVDSYLKPEQFEAYKGFDKIIGILENEEHPYGELLKLMRLFNYAQCDRGLLRTVLMAVKPIKNNDEKVLLMYNAMAVILRAGSTHKVI